MNGLSKILAKTLRKKHNGLSIKWEKDRRAAVRRWHRSSIYFGTAVANMLRTCEKHSRDHKYEFAPEKCEVVPLAYRRDSHPPAGLCR